MIDFGGANGHNNYITFGDSSDIGYMDGFWGALVAVRLRLKSAAGANAYFLGKLAAGVGWGLRFQLAASTAPSFIYRSAVDAVWRNHLCTTALIVGNWYSLVFSWRGDQYGWWYLNGAYINTTNSGAAGPDIVNPGLTTDLHVGGAGGLFADGAAVEMDNVIFIPNLRIRQASTAAFAQDYHAGYIRPWALQDRWQRSRDAEPGIMGPWFWWTGEYVPGYNVVSHARGGHEPGATPAGVPVAIKDHCDSPPWIFLDLGGAPSMPAGARSARESKVGKMPAEMYAEVTERNRTYLGLKLELPDSNDLGFSMAALPTGEQEYELKVKSWSPNSRSMSRKEYKLAPVETSAVVTDPGRVLSKLLAGSLDGRAEGSPAEIRLVSQHVKDPASWMTVYKGELRRWQPRGNLPEITLYLGPNDKPMRGRNRLGYITRDLFPNAPDDVKGQPLQMIYGAFDSLIGGGPISCPKIRWNNMRYLVSVGMVTPLQAYQAGSMLDPRSEYEIGRCIERGGRWFTELHPIADAGNDEITVDVEGAAPIVNTYYEGWPYQNWPDKWAYGRPIANPAEQILHFLVNFVFALYEKGPWLTPSSDMPIDVESFVAAASWFGMRGIKGRTVVYGNETGYQVINRWARQWTMPVFWNIEGKIAVRRDDFAVVRGAQTNLIDREHGVTDLVTILKDDALADGVLIRHNYDWINEKFDDETRADDLSRDYGIVKDIDQDWSAV